MAGAEAPTRKTYDLATADHDYPEWQGPPNRTVLICSHPRSGSTLLGEALYFAGGLGCPLEYFHRGFLPALAARWGTDGMADQIDAVRRLRTDPSGTLSVKLFWRDLADIAVALDPQRFGDLPEIHPDRASPGLYRALGQLLAEVFPNAAFVHLRRRDRVRQAVSSLTASQTGLWRKIPDMGEQAADGHAQYDFDRIDALVGFSDFSHGHWRNFFSANGQVPHSVTYEDIARDYEGSVGAVLAYLGSDAPVPPIRMRRQSGAGNEAFVLRYLREHRQRTSVQADGP